MTNLRRRLPLLALAATLAACEAPGPGSSALELSLGEAPTLLVSTLRGNTVHAWSADGQDLGPVVTEHSLPQALRDTDPFEPSAARLVGEELWVSNFATGQLFAFDDHSGAYLRTVFENGAGVRIEEPAVVQRAGDRTWVLGNDTRNLVGLGDDGGTEEVGEGAGLLRNPHGLALDGDVAYVGTSPIFQDLGLVQVWDLRTDTLLGDFGRWGELEDATGLALEPRGTLLVVDFFASTLSRWDPRTGTQLDVLADADRGLDRPIAVEIQSDGTIWVLDTLGVVRVGDTVERRVWLNEPGVANARGLTLIE